MAAEVFMPQLGLTMTEGKVVRWLKQVGDRVEKGEPVFEVETDKVTQEVNSLDEGTLSLVLVGEGGSVPVGTVIGYLTAPGETLPGLRTEDSGLSEVSGPQSPALSPQSSFVRSSPAARRLAEKLEVDIKTLTGSGPSGRIIEADVRRAAEALAAAPAPSLPSGERIELTGVRKVVAERMAYSFSTAPHFYLTVEVDAANLVALRQQIAPAIQRKHGVDLTVTDLLVKAVAVALREHPEANAAWSDGAVRLNPSVNVGVAAAIGEGLIVPVVPEADRLSLAEVAHKRASLVDRARSGRLTLPELEGGSFTVSNLGMFGIDQFQAIVNPPQAAILAVGRIKDRVVAVGGQVAVRPTMFVSLSSDHRVLDGATAAKFLARVVQLIENPVELLLAE